MFSNPETKVCHEHGKKNRPEFDKIEIQLNRSLEMPGNKMEEFRRYIENV